MWRHVNEQVCFGSLCCQHGMVLHVAYDRILSCVPIACLSQYVSALSHEHYKYVLFAVCGDGEGAQDKCSAQPGPESE